MNITFIFCMALFSCTEDAIEIPEPDTSPPQAMILYPADGDPVSGEIDIQVRAVDNERVDSVHFLINQNVVHKSTIHTNDIFSYTWDTEKSIMIDDEMKKIYEEDEFHYLSAIAFDTYGNSYASSPIRSLVDNIDNEPPNAFFINPFSGQQVSDIVNIEVSATDNDSIQYVSFFVNNILQGYIQEPPYVFPWNTNLIEDATYYSIFANVRDVNNNTLTIPPINVFVDNGVENDNTPPTGVIYSPPAGITVSEVVQIIISANDDYAIDVVRVSIDDSLVSELTQEPYFHNWDTTIENDDKEYTISAVLQDLAGNITSLNPISVLVDNEPPIDNQPPSIMILSPVSGQEINGTINIDVAANDDNGIDRVDYYIDGDSIYTDSVSPYTYEWNSIAYQEDEMHVILVQTFDLEGNSSLAPPVAVIVNNFDNINPTGQILNPIPGQIVSDTIIVEIGAQDNIGIDRVEISINGIYRSTLYEYPYLYSWDTNQEFEDQSHNISAVIYDIAGNNTHANPVSVIVDNEFNDNFPPTGLISSPISGQTVSGLVNFLVSAQDDQGIANVVFTINSEELFTDTEYPYLYEWNTSGLTNDTNHILSATVTDLAGNTIILQPIIVTIQN